MTLENAIVLHKHFLEIGRLKQAKQLEARHPELLNKVVEEDEAPEPIDNQNIKKRKNGSNNTLHRKKR